jgi:hypothetical protein
VDEGGAAAMTVGGKMVAAAGVWHRACGLNTDVRTGPLTGGSHVVSLFPNYPKPVETYKIKMGALQCSKIPKFCMRLDWSVLNNFLNCVNIKFLTDITLKILEQIQ